MPQHSALTILLHHSVAIISSHQGFAYPRDDAELFEFIYLMPCSCSRLDVSGGSLPQRTPIHMGMKCTQEHLYTSSPLPSSNTTEASSSEEQLP